MNKNTFMLYKKATIAAVIAVIALLGFFIAFDPGTEAAAIAVVIALFNVVGVAMAKNHTFDDLSKSVIALQASALGLVSLFIVVNPDTIEAIGAIVLAGLNVYGVWKTTNDQSRVEDLGRERVGN